MAPHHTLPSSRHESMMYWTERVWLPQSIQKTIMFSIVPLLQILCGGPRRRRRHLTPGRRTRHAAPPKPLKHERREEHQRPRADAGPHRNVAQVGRVRRRRRVQHVQVRLPRHVQQVGADALRYRLRAGGKPWRKSRLHDQGERVRCPTLQCATLPRPSPIRVEPCKVAGTRC